MMVEVEHPDGGKVKMPGNPIKLSYTDEDSYTPPTPFRSSHKRDFKRMGSKYEDDDHSRID